MNRRFFDALTGCAATGHPFAIATVIEVRGSASARVGSKALFDETGRNVFGWVGGGCAESFVSENALAAMAEGAPRTVLVDLDDEVFGLGIACGGTMRVFIEPSRSPEAITLPRPPNGEAELSFLLERLNMVPQWTEERVDIADTAAAYRLAAAAVARSRGRDARSLREKRDLGVAFRPVGRVAPGPVLIVGDTRITEALARMFAQVGYEVTVASPRLEDERYPSQVRCRGVTESYDDLDFSAASIIVVAGHHPMDSLFVRDALRTGAAYVGMIGSRKRALEVIAALEEAGADAAAAPLFVPAGIDLDARGPEEIALSVIAEVLGAAVVHTQEVGEC
ncbi:MAG: XdhC family protein [Spirochaetales bacterium]|nr:XdhC family protein [Spirochaetales bacterium]